MTLHFLNGIVNDVMITSLKSEQTCKLIKPDTRLASIDIKFTRLGFECMMNRSELRFNKRSQGLVW